MKFIVRWAGLLTIIFLFSTAGYAASKNLNTAAKQIVAGLSGKLTVSNLNVSIGNLTMVDSKFSSEFARNFLIYVESEMISHPDFLEVKPQQMMKTRGFAALDDDAEDEDTPTAVSLEGKYRIEGDLVYVSVFLRDEKGRRIAEHEVALERSAIPWEVSPPNMDSLKQTENAIKTVQQPGVAFKIALQIDKGDGGVYAEGEELRVFFRTERDCYLKVLYIDVNQNRILMYPTARDYKGKLRAGVDHALHANNRFIVQPPFGAEMIIGVCSTEPVGAANEIDLGGGFSGFGSHTSTENVISSLRGLNTSSQPAAQAEVRTYLTTMPGSKVCDKKRGLDVSSQPCP